MIFVCSGLVFVATVSLTKTLVSNLPVIDVIFARHVTFLAASSSSRAGRIRDSCSSHSGQGRRSPELRLESPKVTLFSSGLVGTNASTVQFVAIPTSTRPEPWQWAAGGVVTLRSAPADRDLVPASLDHGDPVDLDGEGVPSG